MADLPSKTQLDKLGDRLRAGSRDAGDIQALDEYRRSFRSAYEFVSGTLERVGRPATGRPAKTTTAIVDKLNRQNIRLTQIQDIAGLRLVVPNISEQDAVVDQIRGSFGRLVVFDRRLKPSHGYRAVHVVVTQHEQPIEIQVRTRAQHLWAEISEKLADTIDPLVKYGGGPPNTRSQLEVYSYAVQTIENGELELIESRRAQAQFERELEVLPSTDPNYLRLVQALESRRLLIQKKEQQSKPLTEELIHLLEKAYNLIDTGDK